MRLGQAQTIVETVVKEAAGRVSVYVANEHGDRRRGDDGRRRSRHAAERATQGVHGRAQRRGLRAPSRRRLASKPPAELASFDPFFTFFLGGVAAFEGDTRVGAVGVSGLPGADDDALARRALAAAGLETR